MAGVTKVSELEARKKALVTESEICRETLKAEAENLRAYGVGFFKKIDRVRSFGPWLMLAAPMAIPLVRLFGGRKATTSPPPPSPIKSRLAMLMLGLRLYRQYGPLIRSFATQFLARRRPASESRARAAKI